MNWHLKKFFRRILTIALTVLTLLGGFALIFASLFRRRALAFALTYAAILVGAHFTAPLAGRVALPCFGAPLRMQSPFYCLLMHNYVTPELAAVANDAAEKVAQAYPGTVTLALDGNFPFFDGFPLFPHLSHDDGKKLDFAFYYQSDGQYLPGKTRSPVGYWAYELDDSTDCPKDWLTGRWNMQALQTLWPDRPIEPTRTTFLVKTLIANPRIKKAFLEPPLAARLGLYDPKLRFQGCRAARHDDHLHVQL